MTYFYLSFVHLDKPEGEKFVGCTAVQAEDEKDAIRQSWKHKVNPGGEVAILNMGDELPEEGRSFLNRFVPREEVINDGGATLEDLGIELPGVCPEHNHE